MIEEYIMPSDAYKKLHVSRILKQPIYIYGATGFGKTELVRQYLGRQKYIYISCIEGLWNFERIPKPDGKTDTTSIVVIDDMHVLTDEEKRHEVAELAHRKDIWLIMICRSKIPSWLVETFMDLSFLIITEMDLQLNEKDVKGYLKRLGVTLAPDKLERFVRESKGNAYIIKHTAMRLVEGGDIGDHMTEEISKIFADYLENVVIVQWDTEVIDFLMKISVVDEFTVPLAEMITGNPYVSSVIQKAVESGNFIESTNGVYRIRPVLIRALRNRANKTLGLQEMRQYTYNAGIYYEMHGQDMQALELFYQCGNDSGIRNLLIRNARRNPGNGHYFEMRRFYLELEESDIEKDVILMNAMCMLYSLMMDVEKSEYWYEKLKAYHDSTKGGQRREAASRLAYLDIALPHRGSTGILEILKKVPSLLFDKGIGLPEFSVTSNLPSTMNGGKDFCHWSRKDRELAATIGKMMEKILGRYGKGLINVALGESLYEKGCDTYEVLSMLSKAQLETEAGGKMEIAFAAVGLQVRLYLSNGSGETAKNLLDSFEKKVHEEHISQLLPNIQALKCRIALYEGDNKTVSQWLEKAPDENVEFYILERYRYLTKIRCYLAQGEYHLAFSLIEKLRLYAERYERRYIRMELGLLIAMLKSRNGGEWQCDFIATLREICSYQFIRIISEEGAAILPLLEKVKKQCLADVEIDNEWFQRTLEETAKMARRFPVYLKRQFVALPDFSETALNILRLQADGLSIPKIAEILDMNPRTVKYHAQENYRKLGVSGKSEAVLAARNLGIL